MSPPELTSVPQTNAPDGECISWRVQKTKSLPWLPAGSRENSLSSLVGRSITHARIKLGMVAGLHPTGGIKLAPGLTQPLNRCMQSALNRADWN
jgi:hypothetical protein